MENKDLQKLLAELHDEIEKTKKVDAKETELLRHVEGDINALLEHAQETEPGSNPDVIKDLEESVSQFEFEHPTLTAQIYKFLELLSGSGI